MKVCITHGCPEFTDETYCAEHKPKRAPRPSRHVRGYNWAHTRLRAHYAPLVAAGKVLCARCGMVIPPGEPWDLGHNEDRTAWTGPEHQFCNRSAAGKRAHANDKKAVRRKPWS